VKNHWGKLVWTFWTLNGFKEGPGARNEGVRVPTTYYVVVRLWVKLGSWNNDLGHFLSPRDAGFFHENQDIIWDLTNILLVLYSKLCFKPSSIINILFLEHNPRSLLIITLNQSAWRVRPICYYPS
jgi:hypothetical protein